MTYDMIDIIGSEMVEKCEAFNKSLAENYERDETQYLDDIIGNIKSFIKKLGYEVGLVEHDCGNKDLWNEYSAVNVINPEIGVGKQFQCKSYFKKKYCTGFYCNLTIWATNEDEAHEYMSSVMKEVEREIKKASEDYDSNIVSVDEVYLDHCYEMK